MEYSVPVDGVDNPIMEITDYQKEISLGGEKQLNKQLTLPKLISEKVIERKNPRLIFKRAGDSISTILQRKEAEKDLEKIKEHYFYEFFNGNYFR